MRADKRKRSQAPARAGTVVAGRVAAFEPSLRSFLFRGCWARADGGALTVTFPAGPASARFGSVGDDGTARWTTPRMLSGAAEVRCAAGVPQQVDRRPYPRSPPPKAGAVVNFYGAVRYGRLLLADGPALLVQAGVARTKGLPGAARSFDTAEFFPAPASPSRSVRAQRRGVDPSGPHQPFP